MGVACKDLKAMADDGKLTADKVVPALISQLGTLRDEYALRSIPYHPLQPKLKRLYGLVGGANGQRCNKNAYRNNEWCCE